MLDSIHTHNNTGTEVCTSVLRADVNMQVYEFDGDTVLCRVCGDKASGFHYGVHACEGCKGFFRRSIQQKIQYRPCLKNQQCNIMRVNRNRCQYCRLKKCIAVGMSRDAVRFGRVPKKEKAKIMEQMHKVNSQSQVTLLNTILESGSDITQKVVESHLRTCEFTRSKLRAFLDKAWQTPQFVTCPAHMACPLNPSPETSDGTKKWDEFSECFTPAIRNVVNFAKCIPGFQLLSQEDQVTLLKAGTFEVLLVHLACLFDASTNTMCFANGKLYKRVSLTVTNSAGFLLDSMFDFAERLNTMQLSDEEVALFSAIVIIAADRPGLRNVEQVERVQNRITQALQALMSSKHPDDPALFAKLLMKIPDLRTLNTLHSEKLLGLTVPAGSGKNGSAGEKTRTAMDAHPTYFPSGMLPGGFPMFSGPVMPGHMRGEASMQFPGHPPDVSTIMPHQVALDSASPAHNVVLQTPLGTFHRYNNALQQHMSLNRQHSEYPPQHPAARNAGQCPRGRDAGEKEECVDIKPRDFQHVPKFKIEEGVGSNNHVGVPSLSEHRSSREDSRSDAQHGDSRSDSPNVNRDSVSVATSDSGSPKLDVFPPPPPHGSANWASTSSRQSVERPQEPVSHSGSGSVSARSTEHNSNKKRLLSEEDEIMTAKMQKFWNESAGGGCPVGAGYSRSMAGSMQPSLPMSVLQSPSLMSAYRKDAMLQYHHQQQQQYQHHKQFPPPNHHHPLAPRFHSDQLPSTQVDNQRHYPPPTGGLSRQGPGSPEVLPDPSRSPAVSPGCARGENTGVNLPELKNALTRPPLASPGWSGEHGRSESESDTMQEPETRYSGDKHNDLKRSTSPSDPYYLHHEMKAKRRCSNDTVTSEGSGARDQDLHQRDTSGLSYSHLDGPDRGLTESRPPPRRHLSGEHERHSDTLQDERYRSHNEELQRTEPGLESASDLDALRDDGTVRDHHIPSRSQTDPPVLLRSPQFYSESESRDCGNSPPMLVLETEPRLDQVGQSVISRPRSPHIPSTKPMHPDEHRPGVVIENKDSKMRHTNMPYENNNNNKYYLPEVSKPNDNQGQDHHKPLNKSGLGALHGVPNGVHSGGAYMGPGGMAPPHPAYLPLPFPSVHPAIMYQYNQFAAAQMAQLQQMQLAQAQMALHQQVVLSKSEGPYPGVPHKDSPTQGVLPVQRGPTERHRDDATKSEPLREGRPLNLSKPQDMMPTGQQPVFVKPEPL